MKALALARIHVRRERLILPLWILGIIGLWAASGFAVAREFASEQDRFSLAAIATTNPAFLFLRGLPDGTSTGALVFFQTFAFLAVLTALMNTFFVVRHTRADEERGRSELLEATAISRTLALRITLTLAVVANVIVAAGVSLISLALGFPMPGGLLVGLGIGAVGWAFAGLAAVAAQVMPSPRGANGLAAALVGIAYLVRGVGDALGTATDATHVEASWISRLSPIGWAQATAPFSQANPLPVLLLATVAVATSVIAVAIRHRRDLGASLVPERAGRPSWEGATALTLALRLQRGTIAGWGVGAAILGLVAGALGPVVASAVQSNDALSGLISRLAPGLDVDIESAFVVAILGIAGTLATAAGVQALIRLRVEEAEDRAEVLLTTGLSRDGWLRRQGIVAVVSMGTVALVAGTTAGVASVITTGDGSTFATALATVSVHLPAGLVFVGATALAFAVLPRATAAVGWSLLVIGLVIGQMGGLLALPDWLQQLSPFHHVPAVPLEDVDVSYLVLFVGIGATLFAIADAGLRARDIPAT